MKKVMFLLAAAMLFSMMASAQLLPTFQFGVKAGANLSHFSTENTLSSDSRAGFLGGFWARVGGAGLHFQPELYYTSKNVDVKSSAGIVNDASFKSIDLPLLVGTRIGALGVGARFNTGPLISFAIDKDQSTGAAFSNATHLNYKDQNYAWQFGVGLDVQKISFDLRYELGLNKISNNYGDKTRINMFNLTVGYRLFSL
ncbi:PorT family protein [Mucilaginibacter robiniae]|uniref:PorT family protein n=1 Tax=Mucilaginibacter robiniae TaxID=2728022 RepID=A0A7L5E796_9SPHI|nr:porin family protein [Mucilaginibacter robiniae]QJD98179.1 PorT family protein [Mucilaginibacter robiniae]